MLPRRVLAISSVALALGAASLHDAAAEPKRPVPDYDGLGNRDAHPSHPVLWIPRVVLFPLRIVHDYLIRKPLGALVKTAERKHWISKLHDAFTFGPNAKDFIVPTVLYEFGFKPSVGVLLGLRDFGADGNAVSLHGATWGPSWLGATLVDRYTKPGSRTTVGLFAQAVRRPDFVFVAIGPDGHNDLESRFGRTRFDGNLSLTRAFGTLSYAALTAGAQRTSFHEGGCCTDPSLDDQIAAGIQTAPPGYGVTYSDAYQRLDLALDSRSPLPAPGSGAYVHAHGQTAFDPGHDRSWVDYGGDVGAAVDLDGFQRVVRLGVAVDFVDPIKGDVPFDQLAMPGGDMMPGFRDGWLLGRSIAAAQIAYTWPIWMWVDGELRFTTGNAFGEHLDTLAPSKFRFSGEIGMTSNGTRNRGFELIFGLGTETVEQGGSIDSVRIALRTRVGL